jgi:hypothetical protein
MEHPSDDEKDYYSISNEKFLASNALDERFENLTFRVAIQKTRQVYNDIFTLLAVYVGECKNGALSPKEKEEFYKDSHFLLNHYFHTLRELLDQEIKMVDGVIRRLHNILEIVYLNKLSTFSQNVPAYILYLETIHRLPGFLPDVILDR